MNKKTDKPTMEQDKRTQTRVQVNFPISVTAQDKEQDKLITARSEDLSWGGARFIIPEPTLQVGDQVRVQLPWANGSSISAYVKVLRTDPIAEGGYIVASRFSSLSPRSEQRLARLLEMLVAKQSEPGVDCAPFAERLEILFNDAEDMQTTLSEILKGELWVTSFRRYTEDQTIQLALGGTSDLPSLTLRARVFQQKAFNQGKTDWAGLCLIGLKFEHSLRELEAVVDYMMDKLGSRLESIAGSLDLALTA